MLVYETTLPKHRKKYKIQDTEIVLFANEKYTIQLNVAWTVADATSKRTNSIFEFNLHVKDFSKGKKKQDISEHFFAHQNKTKVYDSWRKWIGFIERGKDLVRQVTLRQA